MLKSFRLRKATDDDLQELYSIALAMGASHEAKYFEKCLQEQFDGKRELIVAEDTGQLIGYAQLIWSPLYNLFRRLDIPEIQDLNVVPAKRKCGAGSLLVDFCENMVLAAGKTEVGIAVGLNASFGAAQRLYIKKGYIPDGYGACYDDEPVSSGALRPLDGLFTLKLVKQLQ